MILISFIQYLPKLWVNTKIDCRTRKYATAIVWLGGVKMEICTMVKLHRLECMCEWMYVTMYYVCIGHKDDMLHKVYVIQVL